MIVPPIIEEALWAAARQRLPAEVCGGPALTQAVLDRSRRYTTERERLAAPGGGRAAQGDLAARALFFSIADAVKPWLPLAELTQGLLPAPVGFLAGDRLAVLDVGAGCGAMTLGLLTFLAAHDRRPALDLVLVDHDREALAIAERAIASVARDLGLTVTIDVRSTAVGGGLGDGRFDLVLAGSVLNELDDATAHATALAMLAATSPRGAVIVVEPALRQTSRALHALRDALLAAQRAVVLAPCTRRAAPCPALADERDWCHDHRPLTLPPRTQQLVRATGLRDGDLKLAYLALVRGDVALAASPAVRVVDDPRGEKGKQTLIACGPVGWVPVRLLRRHRAPEVRAFERARRGDLLTLALAEHRPLAAGEICDLGPGDAAELAAVLRA